MVSTSSVVCTYSHGNGKYNMYILETEVTNTVLSYGLINFSSFTFGKHSERVE